MVPGKTILSEQYFSTDTCWIKEGSFPFHP